MINHLQSALSKLWQKNCKIICDLRTTPKCVAITYTLCLKGDPQYFTYELTQVLL